MDVVVVCVCVVCELGNGVVFWCGYGCWLCVVDF